MSPYREQVGKSPKLFQKVFLADFVIYLLGFEREVH